jgi:hypothetical protein
MKKQLSRQRLWQIAQVKQGRCAICAKKRKHYKQFCDACQAKHRELKNRLYRERRAAEKSKASRA